MAGAQGLGCAVLARINRMGKLEVENWIAGYERRARSGEICLEIARCKKTRMREIVPCAG